MVISVTSPLFTVAVAVAPLPSPPEITTVGGLVYPEPPFVTIIKGISPDSNSFSKSSQSLVPILSPKVSK